MRVDDEANRLATRLVCRRDVIDNEGTPPFFFVVKFHVLEFTAPSCRLLRGDTGRRSSYRQSTLFHALPLFLAFREHVLPSMLETSATRPCSFQNPVKIHGIAATARLFHRAR